MAQKPDQTAESKRLVFDFGAGTSTSGVPVRLIDPATEQPMLRAPVVRDFESLRQEYVADLAKRREDERRRVQTASEIVPQRYVLLPGRVLIRARPVETAWDANGLFEMTEERQELMKMHEPWGTVLMVGESFYTDYGQKMELDPRCKPGVQVMFNPAGATDLELPIPGEDETMKLLLVGFRGILMIDLGEQAAGQDGERAAKHAPNAYTLVPRTWWDHVKLDAIPTFTRWLRFDPVQWRKINTYVETPRCGATTQFCKGLPCVKQNMHDGLHRDANGWEFRDDKIEVEGVGV